MIVSEIMVILKMNAWHRFLFWCVNIPRYCFGMDLVVYKCMIGSKVVDGFKVAKINIGNEDKHRKEQK